MGSVTGIQISVTDRVGSYHVDLDYEGGATVEVREQRQFCADATSKRMSEKYEYYFTEAMGLKGAKDIKGGKLTVEWGNEAKAGVVARVYGLGHGIPRTSFYFPRVKHLPMVAAASAITRVARGV